MKSLTLSQAFGILALAFAVALAPSCGGGGGHSVTAATVPPPAFAGKIHASAVGPTVNVSSGVTTPQVIRTVTFTPSDPNDVILSFQVEGTFTMAAGSSCFLGVQVLDGSGNKLGGQQVVMFQTAGTGKAFSFSGPLITLPGNSDSNGKLQNPPYAIQLSVTTGTQPISFSATVVKIVVLENMVVVDPSSAITG